MYIYIYLNEFKNPVHNQLTVVRRWIAIIFLLISWVGEWLVVVWVVGGGGWWLEIRSVHITDIDALSAFMYQMFNTGNRTSTISYNCIGLIHSRISNNWKTFEYLGKLSNRKDLKCFSLWKPFLKWGWGLTMRNCDKCNPL